MLRTERQRVSCVLRRDPKPAPRKQAEPILRALAESALPAFVVRALDPFEARMRLSVAQFAASLKPGSRVLDAGAGESRYAELFTQHRYVALDLAVGDTAWNYSKLDLLGDLECLPLASDTFDA